MAEDSQCGGFAGPPGITIPTASQLKVLFGWNGGGCHVHTI